MADIITFTMNWSNAFINDRIKKEKKKPVWSRVCIKSAYQILWSSKIAWINARVKTNAIWIWDNTSSVSTAASNKFYWAPPWTSDQFHPIYILLMFNNKIHHSLFLFLLRRTISSKTLPDLRWSKRGSTGSSVYIGLSYIALNLSSLRSTLKSVFLLSSTRSSSCYLFFCFYYSCSLRLSFIDFFCFLREGTYSSTLVFFLFFESKPPSKVISMSSSAFLYFLLQVLRQSLNSGSFFS